MNAVQVIVVTYNSAKQIAVCTDALDRNPASDVITLTIVDNASSDDTLSRIPPVRYPIQVIRRDENIGFAKAVNLAAGTARSKYLLLLNPDAEFTLNAVEDLVAFAESNPSFGIYGPRATHFDGKENPKGCWHFPTLWSVFCLETGLTSLFRKSRLFDREYVNIASGRDFQEVDILSGFCVLIRRDVWERLGGFDRSFFMYGEDADFCARAKKLGFSPVLIPWICAPHAVGASAKNRGTMQSQVNAGRLGTMYRHLPTWQHSVLCFLMHFGAWLRLASASILVSLGRPAQMRRLDDARIVWKARRSWCLGYRER